MRRHRCLVSVSAAMLLAAGGPAVHAPAAAADLFGPSYLDLDSVEVSARTASMWRGLDLGRFPIGGAIDLALWRIDGVQDRHTIVARGAAELPLGSRDRPSRADLFELGGGYRYRLDTDGGEANVGFLTRLFGDESETRSSNELAASIQHRVDAPQTELRPMLGVRVARDVQRFDATWVEPFAVLDFGLPPQENNAWSVGGHLDLGSSWSDYRGRGDASRSFGYHATALGLWLSGDRAETAVGPLLAELGLTQWWTSIDRRPRRFVVTLRFVKR